VKAAQKTNEILVQSGGTVQIEGLGLALGDFGHGYVMLTNRKVVGVRVRGWRWHWH
jgi:hypothetical protein